MVEHVPDAYRHTHDKGTVVVWEADVHRHPPTEGQRWETCYRVDRLMGECTPIYYVDKPPATIWLEGLIYGLSPSKAALIERHNPYA